MLPLFSLEVHVFHKVADCFDCIAGCFGHTFLGLGLQCKHAGSCTQSSAGDHGKYHRFCLFHFIIPFSEVIIVCQIWCFIFTFDPEYCIISVYSCYNAENWHLSKYTRLFCEEMLCVFIK